MSECIFWHGREYPPGYGRARSKVWAHRHVWEECFGPIPEGMLVHHTCGMGMCVNPEHLRLITHLEHNTIHAQQKMTCIRGHPYVPENIYVRPNGTRACRICKRERDRTYKRPSRVRAAR
jgi:HNH endonuclease